MALHRCREVTLDINTTAVLCAKRGSQWTYLQEQSYMPMVGHVEQTDQVMAVEFRQGKVQPNQGNLGFIKLCESRLPKEGASIGDSD